MVIMNIPGFSGPTATARHIGSGEEITAIRIAPGQYQFSITSNPEYQIFDGYENGRITNFNSQTAKIQFIVRPAADGRFLM
jgi:hypothetical protein